MLPESKGQATAAVAAATPSTLVALLHGPDQPGLVARVAGWIFERGGNILHADQHRDTEAGIFFQRIEWEPANGDASADTSAFHRFAAGLGMQARVASSTHRTKVAVFVSKADHCFHDLILRSRAGDYTADFALVVSNHPDLGPMAAGYGLPFVHIPVTAATKAEAEARQIAVLRDAGIELVILARYMQVLSNDFLDGFGRPVINIHHSFLPAFVGARPYHQAFERGVKVIGATAHFVTDELDAGPIIVQQVIPVDHTHDAADLAQAGRDVEQMVLARALKLVFEDRVFLCGNRTVIFD